MLLLHCVDIKGGNFWCLGKQNNLKVCAALYVCSTFCELLSTFVFAFHDRKFIIVFFEEKGSKKSRAKCQPHFVKVFWPMYLPVLQYLTLNKFKILVNQCLRVLFHYEDFDLFHLLSCIDINCTLTTPKIWQIKKLKPKGASPSYFQ